MSYILAQPLCDFSTEITQSVKHHTKSGFVSCLTVMSLYKSTSGLSQNPPDLQVTSGISKNQKIFENLHFSLQLVYLVSYAA